MSYSLKSATRLTIATALAGTTLAALAVAAAPGASAAAQQSRSDSRINIASVSVRSLALTLSPKPGTAVLTWAAPKARTKFTIMASPVKRPTATRMLKASAGPVVSFAGLDEEARYVFTVTPQVGAFTGPTSRLLMTATLKQLRSLTAGEQLASASTASSSVGTTTPTASGAISMQTVSMPAATAVAQPEAPQPAAAQQPAAAPAAPAPPRMRTVYVCPNGFTEVSGTCTTTLPYTYSALAYTFHQEAYTVTVQDPGSTYAADRAQSTGTLCPWGGSPNAGGDLCSIPGGTHQETRFNTVKDATPNGYTDTGTEWKKKDAAPAGFTDNGTQWVKTAAKIATEVPA